jgi:acetolactate synthase-1/2/3 large subunit
LTGLAELVSPLVLAPDVERFLSTLASKRALRIEDADRYTENPIHPLADLVHAYSRIYAIVGLA